MEFFTHTLNNGIRCILKRIKSPVAYIALTINAGSRDELKGEEGIAHFTEHSLFKGTGRRKSHHINSRLEKLGGELNAFTTKEETVVHATTLKTDLPKAAELIADIVFNSVYPVREIEKERLVILDEINSYKDSPPERIYDEFEDMLFSGSSLGHNILGSKKTVSGFVREDILLFTGRCYNTDQMVLSVAANITEAAFVRYADKFFGGASMSPRSFERKFEGPVAPFEKTVSRGTYQGHCITGNIAYDLHNPKRIALTLLTNILGGPASNSLLNTIVREKYGFTYNIEASFMPYSDTGLAAIYFGCDKGRVGDCLTLIDDILRGLKNSELSGNQLSAAKKQLTGQVAVSMENKESYMLGAGKSYLVYNGVDSPGEIYKKIAAITAPQILETANEIFSGMSTLVYNNHPNGQERPF